MSQIGANQIKQGAGIDGDASQNMRVDPAGTVNFSGASWTFPADELLVSGDPTAANGVARKSYVDNVATGLSWREPVDVGEDGSGYIGTGTITEINALSPVAGDAVVAEDAGTPSAGTSDALAAGDLAEFDGTSWKNLVTNSGGFPPDGTRALVATSSTFVTGGGLTGSTDEGKVAEWDGTALTPDTLTSPSDGDAVLVKGDGSINEHNAYTFNGAVPTGAWVQFSGAGQINAGDGLAKDGNTLDVDLASNPGLEFSSGQLRIIDYSDGGFDEDKIYLDLDANGAHIALNPNGGLQQSTDTLQIKTDGIGGANLATVMNLSSNGLAVKVDDTTLEESGAGGQLRVKDAGIDENKLATSAAGDGIDGGGGSALSLARRFDTLTGQTGTGPFTLLGETPATLDGVDALNVWLNGVRLHQVGSTPAAGEFTRSGNDINTGDTLIAADRLSAESFV